MEVRPEPAVTHIRLSNGQKVLGICFLLFYLAMIVVTIATLPYATHYLESESLF